LTTIHLKLPIFTLLYNMSVGAKLQETLRARFPVPPTFADKTEEREFRKFRLAQALRIFGECRELLATVLVLKL
jgi:hypothetical protein